MEGFHIQYKYTTPGSIVQMMSFRCKVSNVFQNNRVVMKMDVTHLEHPSLIGKGGELIKKVMGSTGCHIHFPDGNIKCTGPEKSNHVSNGLV